MTRKRLELAYRPLSELRPHPDNPKDHDADEIGAAADRWGYSDPILEDERSGYLAHGHGRLEALQAMQAAGEEPPPFVDVREDGEWLVPVLKNWRSASDSELKAYLMAHNRLTEKGGWDDQKLAALGVELLKDSINLRGTGFSTETLEALASEHLDAIDVRAHKRKRNGDGTTTPPDPDVDPDALPELAGEPRSKRGDLWILGEHRVFCGDSTNTDDMTTALDGQPADMILTDPPFAVYGSSTGVGPDIADDKMVRPFFEALARQFERAVPHNAHVYVHCDWRSWASLWHSFTPNGLTPKNMIVWDKGDNGLGSAYYQCHELIAYFAKMPPPKSMKEWGGQRRVVNKGNIMRFSRPAGEDRLHNAAKPVAMLVELIENSSDPGGRVLDAFLGSGSTLIAAEIAGRRCVGLEIEPKWVDVIVARWEKFTGQKAELFEPKSKPRSRRRAK